MSEPASLRPRRYLLMALPVLVAGFAWGLEALLRHQGGGESLGEAKEATKKAIEMSGEMAKWFIGLASSLIVGTAVYVRAGKPGEQAEPTPFSRLALVFTLGSAVLSIFFGHLWQNNLRDMVTSNFFVATSPALKWPERLQYLAFIVALCSFALLTIERETAPRKTDAREAKPAA